MLLKFLWKQIHHFCLQARMAEGHLTWLTQQADFQPSPGCTEGVQAGSWGALSPLPLAPSHCWLCLGYWGHSEVLGRPHCPPSSASWQAVTWDAPKRCCGKPNFLLQGLPGPASEIRKEGLGASRAERGCLQEHVGLWLAAGVWAILRAVMLRAVNTPGNSCGDTDDQRR